MADIRAQLSRVRDAAISATDRIKDGTGKARESAGDLIQSSKEKASEAYGDARDRTQRVAARANEIVQEHPVAAVAGAVAAGAIIAWMFPKSRRAMKALPGLAMTAGTRVAEAAIAARAAAAQAAAQGVDTVKHGAETVKESAASAINSASEAAAEARETVASAEIPARASKLADDVSALVANKLDALSDAIRARLPKS